jgi:hypothetical protein
MTWLSVPCQKPAQMEYSTNRKQEKPMSTTSSATQTGGPPAASQLEPAPSNPEDLVREAFDDVAILIGGAAASYHLEDALLWTMMTRLDRIRVRVLCDLKGQLRGGEVKSPSAKLPRVHPAIDEFLLRNRERMGE